MNLFMSDSLMVNNINCRQKLKPVITFLYVNYTTIALFCQKLSQYKVSHYKDEFYRGQLFGKHTRETKG